MNNRVHEDSSSIFVNKLLKVTLISPLNGIELVEQLKRINCTVSQVTNLGSLKTEDLRSVNLEDPNPEASEEALDRESLSAKLDMLSYAISQIHDVTPEEAKEINSMIDLLGEAIGKVIYRQ